MGKQYQGLDKVYGFKKKDENEQIREKEDDVKASSQKKHDKSNLIYNHTHISLNSP